MARLRSLARFSASRPRITALLATAVALGVVGAAFAYFVAAGSTTASASVGAINPVTNIQAQQTGTSVNVTWSAATLSNGGAVQGYVVTRSGGLTICGSPSLDTTDSCTDASVPGGSYTYTVTAVFGGFSAAATSSSITILTAPTIRAEPANPSANAAPSFSFDGGNGSGYACQLDGGSYSPCSSPDALTGLANGSHTLSIEATNGSSTGPATSYTWTVDTSAPSITAQPSNPSANTSPSFSFSHVESVYTFECQLDGGGFSTCTSPDSLGGLSNASHTFRVEGIDANGVATSIASYTWTVDNTPPTITAEPDNPSSNTSPSFSFTHTQSAYSFECQLDGGGFSACSSPDALSGLSNGSHTFEVEGAGGDGATTQPASYTWTIRPTAPTGGALTVDGTPATAGGSSSTALYLNYSITSRVDYSYSQSSTLTVQSESLSGGTCGAPGSGGPFTSPVTITGTTQPSGIAGGACYVYTLTGTDNVGNTASISTTVQLPGGAGTVTYSQSIGSGVLSQPTGVAVDRSGNVYVSDQGYGDVLTFDSTGNNTGQLGGGVLGCPTDVAVDSSGNVYASDPCSNDGVTEFDQYNNELATFGSGDFCDTSGVAVDSFGNVYGSDSGCGETYGFDPYGNTFATYGYCGNYNHGHVAVDASGDVYEADQCGGVVEFDQYGGYLTRIGAGVVGNAASVAIDATGNIYVLDIGNNDVDEFDPSGNLIQTIGAGQLQCPNALAVDPFRARRGGGSPPGPTGNVYVLDPCQGAVLEFTQGSGNLPAPASLALSPNTSTVISGSTATVTATVTDSGANPLNGVPVQFAVSGGNSTSATVTTNQSGQATFSYLTTNIGTDTVSAYVDINNDGTDDPGDPSDTATVTVTPPPPTISTHPADPTNSFSASFSFSESSGGYTFDCQLDGAGFTPCTSPQPYSGLADGSHTFQVEAIGAGGTTPPASYTWLVDTTPPTNSLSLAGGAYLSGNTLYYNASAPGSFSLTDAVTDLRSGPASATFPAIATVGWAHNAETVTSGSGSAPTIRYQSSAFSWTANPSNPSGYAASSKDLAGNSATTPPVTFVDDTTAPSGGALSVNGTIASGGAGSTSTASSTSFAINSRTDYSEAQTPTQSGLAASTLTVRSESLTGSTCGSPGSGGPFTAPTTIGGTTQPSGITTGACYLYTLTGTSNDGVATSISTTVALPNPPGFTVNGTAATAGGSSSTATTTNFAITGRTDYSQSSTLTVQSESLSGGTCGAPGSGGPFTSPVTVTGTTQPSGIVADACYLYTLTGTDNMGNTASVSTTVTVYNFAVTATIKTGIGSNPRGVAVDPVTDTIYVTNQSSNTVSVINGATNTVTAVIPVGSTPTNVGVDSATDTIYVGNNGGGPGTVSVINGATNTVTATLTGFTSPSGVAVNPVTDTIYVTGSYDQMWVINGATNAVTGPFTPDACQYTSDEAVDPTTDTVYVPGQFCSAVSVINGATDAVTATVPVGSQPVAVDVDPATDTVYATNYGSNTVSVINGATNDVTATVAVGGEPWPVGVDSATDTIYVGNYNGNTVSVISGATNEVLTTLPVGGQPIGLAVDSATGTAYVANFNSNTVSVIAGS